MGIQGLLPLLKSVTTPVHIKDYSGKTAAVDTYCWLHKGAISCSRELCQGLPTTKYIEYCMHRINLLRQHGVKPLLIFDGGILPMKEEQEKKRARSRKANMERAVEHETSGNHAAAYDCYQKAVDITPQIALQFVKVLQQEKIDYIVAPYEADAQMAFLSMNGLVDVVITEDSDMIPFGCLRVIFKLDKFGQGIEFLHDDLAKNRDLNFTSFTKQMLLEMCILSGCDYLPSLQGMGVKKAHGLIRRFRNHHKVIKHLRYNGACVPTGYEEMFTRAILTFQHQWVYDPVHEDVVHLTPLQPDVIANLEFLGPGLSKKLGQAIARGEVDPITRKPFELCDVQIRSTSESLHSKLRTTNGKRKRPLNLPVQKNVLTNYLMSVSSEAKRQFKAPRNESFLDVGFFGRNSIEAEEDNLPSIKLADSSIDILVPRVSDNAFEHCQSSGLSFISEEDDDQIVSFLDSKLAEHSVPADSLEAEVVGHGLAATTVTKKNYVQKTFQGNCVIRSVYFSKSKLNKQPSGKPGTGPPVPEDPRVDDFVPEPETHESARASQAYSQPRTDVSCGSTKLYAKRGGKSVDWIAAGIKKHIPDFSSKLLGSTSEPVKFASDTSHIEQYASIAQKSMERFVSAIAPFRCSALGARASGLRKPAKLTIDTKASRSCAKMDKPAENLDKFAFTSSKCRTTIELPEAVPVPTGVATRWNSSLPSDWN